MGHSLDEKMVGSGGWQTEGYQTVDELTTNQITAALYERSRLLQRAIRRLEGQAPSVDRDFAMSCNQFALLHTNRALLEVSRRLPEAVA